MFNLLLIPVSAVLFGGLWGYIQGMIMIQAGDYMAPCYSLDLNGVRAHIKFRIYHRLCIYCLLAFVELVILWASNIPWIPWMPFFLYLVFSLGCGLLGWGGAEFMYFYARFGYLRLSGSREHFTMADIISLRLSVAATRILHILRLCGGVFLILIAVFTKRKSPRRG